MNTRAFTPRSDSTVNIDVSSSSQSAKVCDDNGDVDVRVMNNGSATAWIKFGGSGLTADTTNDIPVGPGVTEVLRAPPLGGALYVAVIAAGSTGKIYFTPGSGI